MLNNAGERSEPRKFCILTTKYGEKAKLEHFFSFFFADFRGGGGRKGRSESATDQISKGCFV